MTSSARKRPISKTFRAGWFDVTEGLAKKLTPASGYDVALIGPNTLDDTATDTWRASIEAAPQVLNSGYLSGPEVEGFEGRTVRWTDAATARATAECLFDARRVLSELLEKRGTGGAILIDAGSISKTLLAALLGMIIRTRSASSVDILYRRREYTYQEKPLDAVYAAGPLSHSINDIEFCFSAIPYVEGKYKSGKRRHCIVLCGLDFQRVLGKVGELEPASIDLVIEKEAVAAEGNSAALKKMCGYLGIGTDALAEADRTQIGTVVDVLNRAIERARGRDLHPVVITAGGKPFTIAAALQSLLHSEAPLLATIPDRVVELQSKGVGDQHVYRLADRTALL
jgi:hypothetical protein